MMKVIQIICMGAQDAREKHCIKKKKKKQLQVVSAPAAHQLRLVPWKFGKTDGGRELTTGCAWGGVVGGLAEQGFGKKRMTVCWL